MVTTNTGYERALKKLKSNRPFAAAAFYKWKPVDPAEKGRKKTLFGICGGCMQRDCATLVHLEDGIVVGVEGNPDCPPNYGSLCGRGRSQIMGLYNPYRVKTPLVRTNPEKGLDVDPMWKEVTWDEALNIVAEKLKAVRAKDPRSLVICEGFGQRENPLRLSFGKAFGTPNEIGTHGPLCTIHYASNLVHAGYPEASVDLEYGDYIVSFGRSLGPNFATTGATRRFTKAIARGMQLVVFDPRSSYEASKGEWIPIRPNSGLACLLAMTHVMMHEGLAYDEWFMKNRTNAPYLIGPDGNYYRDPATQKPMIWDAGDNCAKTFDVPFKEISLNGTFTVNGIPCRTGFDLIKEEMAKYTPEWAEKICTVPAATIRRITGEFVKHARIGSTIKIDNFTFPYRPASVNIYRGVANHRGGTYADLTSKLLNMLIGNIEVPGGCIGNSMRGPMMAPDEDGVIKPTFEAIPMKFKFPPDHIDCHEYYPHKHTGPHLAVNAMLHPEAYHHDYKIEAWLTIGGNPLRSLAQPDLWLEAFKQIPFIVSIAYHMDEMTCLADVVLPEHSTMERAMTVVQMPSHQSSSAEITGKRVAYTRQPVPTVFNTRHADEIFMDIAERVGFLYGKDGLYDVLNKQTDRIIGSDGFYLGDTPYKLDLNKKYTISEIHDRQLKSWKWGTGRGLTELNSTGFVSHPAPMKGWFTYYFHPDTKTRHPFYFERLKRVGDELRANLKKVNIKFPLIDDEEYIFDLYRPIPHWVEDSEFNAPPEYDLYVINWKTPFYSNDASNIAANPWLAELVDKDAFENGVRMNTATAQKKGLKEGDIVVIESRYGKTRGVLHLTELLHPDALGIPGGSGIGTAGGNPLNRRGVNWNFLLTYDPKTLDPVSAGMECSPKVKVYKEGGR